MNPRSVALELFTAVFNQQKPLDALLSSHHGFVALSGRDRAFVRRLVATLLRRLGQVDHAIDFCLAKPLSRRQADLRDLLRLGAVQLLFLETPAHAAVSTSLNLAKHPRLAGQKKLINAILRRLSREGEAIVNGQDAARLNTPDWLWDSWCSAYGPDKARRIAEAHLSEAPLDLSLTENQGDWAEKLNAEVLPGGSLRLLDPAGDVTALPGFEEGAWWVQDFAASLPARLLKPTKGQNLADLCAAPGGKTAYLALHGAQVTAVDKSKARLHRLRENLGRLGLTAQVIAADGATWRPEAPLDGLLLDAPCSATGTIRRHPDVAYLKDPERLGGLLRTQTDLLRAALEMIRPGGILVYAVCSLQLEEGPLQIEKLLAENPELRRLPVEPEEVFGQEDLITPVGDLRTLPSHFSDKGGMDGFFACRLQTS